MSNAYGSHGANQSALKGRSMAATLRLFRGLAGITALGLLASCSLLGSPELESRNTGTDAVDAGPPLVRSAAQVQALGVHYYAVDPFRVDEERRTISLVVRLFNENKQQIATETLVVERSGAYS